MVIIDLLYFFVGSAIATIFYNSAAGDNIPAIPAAFGRQLLAAIVAEW